MTTDDRGDHRCDDAYSIYAALPRSSASSAPNRSISALRTCTVSELASIWTFISLGLGKMSFGSPYGMVSAEQRQMEAMIEQKQMKDFLKMYANLVDRCFNDCCQDFTSQKLSTKEVGRPGSCWL